MGVISQGFGADSGNLLMSGLGFAPEEVVPIVRRVKGRRSPELKQVRPRSDFDTFVVSAMLLTVNGKEILKPRRNQIVERLYRNSNHNVIANKRVKIFKRFINKNIVIKVSNVFKRNIWKQ
tara:strand:- start:1386 stop:1748 length:363 start_codon:yes stop_codon:yes gene_type:complete